MTITLKAIETMHKVRPDRRRAPTEAVPGSPLTDPQVSFLDKTLIACELIKSLVTRSDLLSIISV